MRNRRIWKAWASAIRRLESNRPSVDDLRGHAAAFTWREAAAGTWEVFDSWEKKT